MINTIKLKASLLVTALGVLFLAATVFAATNISFSPTTVNVKAGQSFSLVLSINPQGGKNYTIKMGLDYPADLLEVSSFTFGNNWMPLVQSGYDVVDNTNGVFIKTAGYPGGLASNAVFGTVTFIAKKSGSGTIDFNPNESMALDGSNQNVVNGAVVQTLVTVTAVSSPSSTPSQSQSDSLGQSSSSVLNANSNSQSQTSDQGSESSIDEDESSDANSSEQSATAQQLLLAQAAELVTFGTYSNTVGVSVVAGLTILGYLIYALVRTKRRKEETE